MSKYITTVFNSKFYDTFICHLGDRSENKLENMDYICLEKESPLSSEIWSQIMSDEFLVIDVRRINTALAMVLYARYLRCPQKTFLILTSEQEKALDWGYGAGVCDWEDEENLKSLTRLQRDIAFFLSLEDSTEYDEPVREFLEKYWGRNGFEENNWENENLDFDRINLQEENTGEAITSRLKECVAEEDVDGFKNELRNMNGNNAIDYMDYIVIGRLCKDMNLMMHRVHIMEQGYKKWKDTIPKLKFELIDALTDSPNRNYREKALKMAEDYFGITRNEDGGISLSQTTMNKGIEEDYLKSLFNAYISLGKFDELLYLADLENHFIKEKAEGKIKALFLRNKAICLREKGEYERALLYFKELYEQNATENTLILIAATCESSGRVMEAAKISIAILLMNYMDVGSRIRLAEVMLKHRLLYIRDMEWEKVVELERRVEKQIVPVLMEVFSMEANQKKVGIIYDIYKILDMIHDEDAMNYLINNKDKLAYIWGNFIKEFEQKGKYDFSLVNDIKLIHKKAEENSLKISEYIKQALSINEKGHQIEKYDEDRE
ncbi:MAG: hypothetical protein HFG55_10015 [Lachnospiraceae bacterium]|nr:hypothetical protein [Lachnospiraceae bacterium]